MQTEMFPTVPKTAPLIGRGIIFFVNIRPDLHHGRWICDECCERVTRANFDSHIRRRH